MDGAKLLGLVFGTLASAAALWGVGYSMGSARQDDLVALLGEQNDSLESTTNVLRREKEALRAELLAASRSGQNASPESPLPTERGSAAGDDGGAESEPPSHVRVRVDAGETEAVFDDGLFLSVSATDYTGDPLRHQLYGTIGAPGCEPLVIEGVDVGYVATYEGFEVRLAETGTFHAAFVVRALPLPDDE